jgi:hypothetical protein
MIRFPLLALLALLLHAAPVHADDRVAIVRSNGLLVFLPGVGGADTYGTYLVPNELGRAELDRFLLDGNPIQINFLPPSELPDGFSRMSEQEKLEAFFLTEIDHLTKAFNQKIQFNDMEPSSFGGVNYLAGTVSFLDASGRRLKIRIKARVAGRGILHASYQPENPDAVPKAQAMVDELLRSFELVRKPLTPEELSKHSKAAME